MFEVTAKEVIAFNELAEAKERLKGAYVTGRQNVMDPLYRFSFSEKQRIRYFCHLYSYIDGETLEDYFKKQTVSQAYITAAKILPDIVRGLIYLYNAGIIHDDMFPKNVMLQLDSDRRIIGVKIIDLDATKYTVIEWISNHIDNENVMTLAQHNHTTADIAL
ncbi:hypothetical protein BDF22DRAFT_655609 [Syncephalis plumigaleata]|nr:hypothetical protein BDF22DRAFT_655609 [Syncephalis plumigaleata]